MRTKALSEREIIRLLEAGEITFPPVCLRLVSPEVASVKDPPVAEGILEANWQGRSVRFVFECKALSTPKVLEVAIAQVQRAADSLQLLPLVIVPYLSEEALGQLEGESVSGIDLSGNGILLTKGMAVWRSGHPNRFKTSLPLRNVYRGVSALVAQSFLLRAEFASLVELQAFAQERLAEQRKEETEERLTKGTVSKVIHVLEEDKIVFRDGGRLRVLSPRTLLERLQANYKKPQGRKLIGKTSLSGQEIWNRLQASGLRVVTTGQGSAGHYRVLSGADTLSLYVEEMDAVTSLLDIKATQVFPNLELIEYRGEGVYFDAREVEGVLYASPIRTWLELATSGPREREAAKVLEAILLRGEGEKLQ